MGGGGAVFQPLFYFFRDEEGAAAFAGGSFCAGVEDGAAFREPLGDGAGLYLEEGRELFPCEV